MDAEQLEEHLRRTPHFIKRHRSRLLPGGIGYSDAPCFGGYGSKSPCSDHAMELADLEAAFVGNLARYCMAMGTIPPHSLKGLWWVDGECKGLGVVDWESDVEPIMPLINHLIRYAPFIIGTEGVEDLLKAGEATRAFGEKMFPNESGEWITVEAAAEKTGRTERTVWRWINSGAVRAMGDKEYCEILSQDIDLLLEIIEENKKRSALSMTEKREEKEAKITEQSSDM